VKTSAVHSQKLIEILESKDTELNALSQSDCIDLCRTLYLRTTEYVYFPYVHGTLTKIAHSLGNKMTTEIKKDLKSYIVQNMSCVHTSIKLEIRNKKKTHKSQTLGN
jgi:hypothetical protein